MDYELAFFSEISLVDWARYIYDILDKKMELEVNYKEHSDYISIGCECLSFIIDTDEIIGVDVLKDVFSFEANISIRIQIFGKTFHRGLELLFKMLSIIVKEKIEDFILLENGSEVILKRINGDIYTYIQKGYDTDFPFGLLEKEIKVI